MDKDYKKLYEEALERAKIFKSPYCQHAVEQIFPELKESEDEKIKKAIVKMISDIDGGFPFEKHGIIKKKALAWLERQGEKSVDESEPKFIPGECIRYRGENYKIKDIEKTKNGFIYNVSIIGKPSDTEEVKTAIGFTAEKDMVKIEQPAWSEEDGDALDTAICIIQNGGDDCAGILDSDKAIKWLKSLKPQNHWKPNEEQMEALKYCIDSLGERTTNFSEYYNIESLYNALKKL